MEHQYIDFHDPQELIDVFKKLADERLSNPKICWYKDFLQFGNFFSPIQFKNNEDRKRFAALKYNAMKDIAIRLGLDHFLNVPSSRGTKMNVLSSKWEREHVLPLMIEHILPITEYDEMASFFSSYSFFCGRRDWTWGKHAIDIAPYPEFKSFSPIYLDIASLCEANDAETVKLIIEYQGCAYGSGNREVLYPKGWSMEKYQESLTDEDKELIRLDKERLEKLHNHIG